MTTGLPVSRLISVSVNLTPLGAQAFNFDSLLVVGDSNVIDVSERIRSYASLTEVATDFGGSAPEYTAAALFFGQSPAPEQLYIGRWAQVATAGLLVGGPVSALNQAIAAWTAINNGAFRVTIDGVGPSDVGNLNFGAQVNLNGVAAVITSGLPGGTAICTWDPVRQRFTITSQTSGAGSTISFLSAPNAGTDISAMLAMTGTPVGAATVNGIAAETAAAAVAILDAEPTQWYGLTFASTHIVDVDHLAIAAFVEASGNPHVYGLTTSESSALVTGDVTSIGAQLKALGYDRTFYQYSSTGPYAVAAFFGRAFTVDFNGNLTTITMMFKQEIGVAAEELTTTQANALDANNYNYFVGFNNNTDIIVNGKVASGQFFDTIWDVDWLANAIQTNVYNLLFTSTTKIPQTDAGMHQIATQIEAACAQGVANGALAPGIWNAGGFGQLKEGQFLSKGYYVFTPPLSSQSEADRAARRSVPFQVAAKLAGAVHSVAITVNVNP